MDMEQSSFLRRLFSFQGRIGRRQYWIAMAVAAVCVAASILITNLAALFFDIPFYDWKRSAIALPFLLASAYIGATATARRLHDTERRLAWILVPLALSFLFFVASEIIYWQVGGRFVLLKADRVIEIVVRPFLLLTQLQVPVSLSGFAHAWTVWDATPLGQGRAYASIFDSATGAMIGAWYLYEVGLRRGTAGPNPFGPDPLGTPSEPKGQSDRS